MTLTEQAKASPYGRQPYQQATDEQLDMCIAWANGEIATRQVSDVLDREPTPTVYWVANAIRQAAKAGRITITRNA